MTSEGILTGRGRGALVRVLGIAATPWHSPNFTESAPEPIPLYESEPAALANAQMAAIGERVETDSMRRLNLELLAG